MRAATTGKEATIGAITTRCPVSNVSDGMPENQRREKKNDHSVLLLSHKV
ncbi:MAG: hypothetical protein ACXACI_06330 [Candidatus Hodarchaeales archaeon]|jgi:hypothetical protein